MFNLKDQINSERKRNGANTKLLFKESFQAVDYLLKNIVIYC